MDTLEEEMYGDYVRDYLTVMFSHPTVDGFLMWGFCASATAIHPRALLCLAMPACSCRCTGSARYGFGEHTAA